MKDKKSSSLFGVFLGLILGTIGKIMRPFTYLPYRLGYLAPITYRDSLKQMLIYAGVVKSPEEVIGITMIYGISVALVIYVVSFVMHIGRLESFGLMVAGFVAIWVLLYVVLNVIQERRTQNIEKLLPDVLSIISQNMISGSTSYNALWAAARPEFGPLALEIQNVARDTLAGAPLAEALTSMTNKVKSDKLDRSVKLMIQGMKSGGDLPEVLQGISMDMRAEQNIEKTMYAETSGHAMFILFTLLIGAPLLFAVSIVFVSTFSGMFEHLGLKDMQQGAMQGGMKISGISITPDFFYMYAVIVLGVSALFGALLTSIIRTGRMVQGVKNIPVLIVVTLAIFSVLKSVLGGFFGGMIT
ncbi:MAG: hypothetical protein MSIBF_03020 [Candidatus Altiarchaeales archaeon IMC4]|nr:MAG: hypothetical protein MSIBF_03020 [Candidatus Altiarchaeales archaeon IMC4]